MSSEHNNPRNPIRIGSRGSQLALWQANHILYALRDAGIPAEIEVIRTTGDRMQQPGFVPPPNLDGKGIFIKEIEEALEEGRIDLAVHSLKDLPTKIAPQFTLAAIPKRADARDVWVCEPLLGASHPSNWRPYWDHQPPSSSPNPRPPPRCYVHRNPRQHRHPPSQTRARPMRRPRPRSRRHGPPQAHRIRPPALLPRRDLSRARPGRPSP